jgi:hypothetical protein
MSPEVFAGPLSPYAVLAYGSPSLEIGSLLESSLKIPPLLIV